MLTKRDCKEIVMVRTYRQLYCDSRGVVVILVKGLEFICLLYVYSHSVSFPFKQITLDVVLSAFDHGYC